MNVLEQFYSAHLHYTVAFRLWTDTCRQLAECKGSPGERQALALNCIFPLWENERYFRITNKYPLPEEGNTSLRKFKLYLMLYFYVMRDAGLLNREAELAEQDWNRRKDAFGVGA